MKKQRLIKSRLRPKGFLSDGWTTPLAATIKQNNILLCSTSHPCAVTFCCSGNCCIFWAAPELLSSPRVAKCSNEPVEISAGPPPPAVLRKTPARRECLAAQQPTANELDSPLARVSLVCTYLAERKIYSHCIYALRIRFKICKSGGGTLRFSSWE